MINHESQFELVCTRAQELISSSHFGSEDVVIKRRALQNSWEQLKAFSTERNKNLNDSLEAHQVLNHVLLLVNYFTLCTISFHENL